MQPLISICVPIYGVEKYIERCARSLFAQTYSDVEYIFVDDCGKDQSVEILNRVIAEYPEKKVQLLRHEQNRGLAAARNTAVAAAKGDFIMHLDSDDWLEPDAVEILMTRQQETSADIVSGNALAHYADHEEELVEPDYASVEDMVHQTIKLTLDHVVWRRVIRKSLYDEHAICTVEGVNIGEDHHTLPRLVYYAKAIAKVDKVVYHYNCVNENSYMQAKAAESFNAKRYRNDRDSINMLLDFFAYKDESCVQELKGYKMEYAYRNLWGVLKDGNQEAFDELCRDMQSVKDYADEVGWTTAKIEHIASHYRYYWLLVRWRILLKKVTGKKNYTL